MQRKKKNSSMRFLVILLPQVCEESPVNLITSKSLVFGMIQDVKVFLLLETKPALKCSLLHLLFCQHPSLQASLVNPCKCNTPAVLPSHHQLRLMLVSTTPSSAGGSDLFSTLIPSRLDYLYGQKSPIKSRFCTHQQEL